VITDPRKSKIKCGTLWPNNRVNSDRLTQPVTRTVRRIVRAQNLK